MEEDEFARALLSHERKAWQDPEAILDQIKLEPGNKAADLGCGPGFFTLALAQRVAPGGMVYAVDSSPLMLDYLRSNIKRKRTDENSIKIIESDVSKTGIPSHSQDFVLVANVLHDVEDRARFLGEVKRIARPNAAILDIDWVAKLTPLGPPEEIRLAESDARIAFEKAGFRINQGIEAGPYHYGLLCKVRS